MGEHRNVWERIIHAADLGTETPPNLALIELVGNKRVLVENHHGISQYGSNEISVNTHDGCIHICGQNLDLVCMSKDQLIITGTVESVKLCNRR